MKDALLTFIFFVTVCACIYWGVLAFFSFISGWRRLSIISPAPTVVESNTALFTSQSVFMGLMDYTMCVRITFTDTGMIFSMPRVLSYMHKPCFIPYEKTGSVKKTDSEGPEIEFTVEDTRIRLSGDSAAAFEMKKKNPALPAASLRPADGTEGMVKDGQAWYKTRVCGFDDLQMQFTSPVRDFAMFKKIPGFEKSIRHCYETVDMKKGIFGTNLQQFTDMLITMEWFFWGISGDGVDTAVGCARLKDIAEMQGIDEMLGSGTIEIKGIDISGFHYDESRTDPGFTYSARDETGKTFIRELGKAVKNYHGRKIK